jgi:hypothetical protein
LLPDCSRRAVDANSEQPLFDQLPDRVKKPTARPTPTKKRSAPAPNAAQGSRAGSVTLPSRPDLQDGIPQRRSEEVARPAIGLLRREARAPPQRTASFDTIGFQHGALAGQNFTNFQDILPMNMSLSGTGSRRERCTGTPQVSRKDSRPLAGQRARCTRWTR